MSVQSKYKTGNMSDLKEESIGEKWEREAEERRKMEAAEKREIGRQIKAQGHPAGDRYWCVKTPLEEPEDGIFVRADKVIIDGGTLTLCAVAEDGRETINFAFAPGQWHAIYAANVLDGVPVAVEWWKTEGIRQTETHLTGSPYGEEKAVD
jgi:hypothetical protein